MPGGVDLVLGPLSGFLPLPSLPGALHGAEGSPQSTGAPASTEFSQVSLCAQIIWISVTQGLLQNFSGETQTEVDKLNKQSPQKARLKVSIISEVKGTKVNADGSS